MGASSAPSPNTLLLPKKQRRLSTFNFGMVFIIVGLVGAIIMVIAFSISQMNAKPASTLLNGAPVTEGSSPQDLGMTGPTNQGMIADAQPTVSRAASRIVGLATPAPHMTSAPAAYQSTSGDASSGEDEAAAQAREARRRAADDARAQLERRQERIDASMHSLGALTVADDREINQGVAAEGASAAVPQRQADTSSAAVAQAREYPAPAGPMLALDTSIPVELTRAIDSTFGGQFEVRVTGDVLDETQRTVIVPRDTRCYAKANAGGVEGQARLYVAVDLCKLPNRERLVLDDFPAVDVDGATGIKARVDDHGAGRRGRSSSLMNVPGMLVGSVIPQAGLVTGAASSAAAVAQSSQVGQAMPGPTLYVDASPQHPRSFSILVTHDTSVNAYAPAVASEAAVK